MTIDMKMEKIELRIIQGGKANQQYFVQRKYPFLLFFHKWKTIYSTYSLAEASVMKIMYVPKEVFERE